MEYVVGQPIDAYCEERALSTAGGAPRAGRGLQARKPGALTGF